MRADEVRTTFEARKGAWVMWQTIEVSVGPATHRGRYRLEGRRLVLEWRGGRAAAWCGLLRPEVVAAQTLRRLAGQPLAA